MQGISSLPRIISSSGIRQVMHSLQEQTISSSDMISILRPRRARIRSISEISSLVPVSTELILHSRREISVSGHHLHRLDSRSRARSRSSMARSEPERSSSLMPQVSHLGSRQLLLSQEPTGHSQGILSVRMTISGHSIQETSYSKRIILNDSGSQPVGI